MKNLSMYLVELSLMDKKMFQYKNSLVASAAIYLSMKIFKKEHSLGYWP